MTICVVVMAVSLLAADVTAVPERDFVIVDGAALRLLLPLLEVGAARVRRDGGDPRVLDVVEALRFAALLGARGTVKVPQGSATRRPEFLLGAESSSSSRVGLTVSQAAELARIGVRGMRKRGPGMQDHGTAWMVGNEWRFDADAVLVRRRRPKE